MPTVKYSRVPTDEITMSDLTHNKPESPFDYSSPFNYSHTTDYSNNNSFQSIFTYKNEGKPKIWHGDLEDTVRPSGFTKCCVVVINVLCYVFLFLTFPISAWFLFKRSKDYEKIVIFRLGRLLGIKEPGVFFVVPCIDKWIKVDTRTRAFSVPPQRMFTIDGAVVEVGADVYFNISDVLLSVINVQDMNHSIRVLAQTSMQNHLTNMELSDIEKNKNFINDHLQTHINATTGGWGININRFEVSQVKVLQEPVQGTFLQGNPLQALGPVLYPPGSSNTPTPGNTDIKSLLSMMMPPQVAEQVANAAAAMKTNSNPPTLPVNVKSAAKQATIVEIDGGAGGVTYTARSLLQAVQPVLDDQLVQSFGAVYQFIVHGESGGVFYLDLKNGCGAVGEGDPPGGTMDVIISLAAEDLDLMLKKELEVFQAYVGGKLRFKGDMNAAMKLESLIDKVKPRLVRQ